MMQVTIEIPDKLARELESAGGRLAEIIQLGLKELSWVELSVPMSHVP